MQLLINTHLQRLARTKSSMFVESKSEDNIFEMDMSLKNGSNVLLEARIAANKVVCPVNKLRSAYKKLNPPRPEKAPIVPKEIVYGFQ